MFAGLIFSKKIKYIGYAIVFIMVAIPIGLFFNDLYVGALHMFGGETKNEKLTRLTNNESALKDSINSKEKEKVFVIKKTKVLTTIIVRANKDKVKNKSDVLKSKNDVYKKIEEIKHKVNKKRVLKKKIFIKVTPIVVVNNAVKYKEVGVVLSSAMFDMYDKAMEVK